MITKRGVHKSSEQELIKGRSLYVTEEDKNKYNWDEIPYGSKYIDETTGLEKIKLKEVLVNTSTNAVIGYGVVRGGKVYELDRVTPILKADGTQYTSSEVKYAPSKDWVPTSEKYEGTLCIAKDAMIIKESFKVEEENDGNDNVVYSNLKGEKKTSPILSDGSVSFELEEGTYTLGRHHLEAVVGTVTYTVQNGGLVELSRNRFAINDSEGLHKGQVIRVTYVHVIDIGNPYPRIFLGAEPPKDAEPGDLWIDTSDFINTDLGIFVDKTLCEDEKLDGGFQPKEPNTPDDVEN